MAGIPYQPFWCEENVWQLAAHAAPGPGGRLAIILTGADGEVACWRQRAGPEDGPLAWDYHAVLAAGGPSWRIWDPDCRDGCPLPAAAWLDATFPRPDLVPPPFRPRFAVYDAADYLRRFGSDRSHMRSADGTWQHAPPPWPAIAGEGLDLARLLSDARQGIDLAALRRRLA